jgi:hypothetical protein
MLLSFQGFMDEFERNLLIWWWRVFGIYGSRCFAPD